MAYKIKKGLEKVAWGLLYAVITGALVIWQDDPKYVAIIPILMWVQNYVRHK